MILRVLARYGNNSHLVELIVHQINTYNMQENVSQLKFIEEIVAIDEVYLTGK